MSPYIVTVYLHIDGVFYTLHTYKRHFTCMRKREKNLIEKFFVDNFKPGISENLGIFDV